MRSKEPFSTKSGNMEKHPAQEGGLTLVVETETSFAIRRVGPPSQLRQDVEIGLAAEAASRDAASTWGLPDFVFRSVVTRKGSAVRELGDAILIVGDLAAVVQVKAREAHPGDQQKETSWLQKKITKASSQAVGTIRSLSSQTVELVNERGRQIQVDGSTKQWVAVVLVDHPEADRYDYVPSADAVVILRRDWEFLFEQLRSTHAVIQYLHRVRPMDPEVLGHEPARYYDLASADEAASPAQLPTEYVSLGGGIASTPLLPKVPGGAGGENLQDHLAIHEILSDIATSPLNAPITEPARLDVLAAVDTLPVGQRADLGGALKTWLVDVAQANPGELKWRFRNLVYPKQPRLLFGVATRFSEEVQLCFSTYVRLRHQQFSERLPGTTDELTVGILLTPRFDGLRSWDTTLAATAGDQMLARDERAIFEEVWGQPGQQE
jgi:hypothetical protein